MFRQGTSWAKLASCVLAFMLLASRTVASPPLDTTNPTSFFTNVATAMFKQMDLHDFNGNLVTVTNIPIYEDPAQFGGTNINYYTPAVHRILQLAANLYDATTNRFIDGGPTNYPTVFRPIFCSQNGIATIVGYSEVTNTAEAFLPMLNASDFVKAAQPLNSSINMYGVPWVIGARKGFPNFNEFSMENSLTVTRTLEFTNSVAGKTTPPWQTNQLYDITVTNMFGVEAWNSYTNGYGRPLRLVVSNELSLFVTNGTGFSLLTVSNLPFGTNINSVNGWTGWTRQISDTSFVVPLLVSTNFAQGIYGKTFFVPQTPARWTVTFVPQIFMTLQSKVRYVLIDTAADRVIDFVNIVKTEPAVDVGAVLQNGYSGTFPNVSDSDAIWDRRLRNGIEMGILNQIETSRNPSAAVWTDPDRFSRAQIFNNSLNGNTGTTAFKAPYAPQRTIYQRLSMEANDPLVHYTAQDLTRTNGSAQAAYNFVELNSRHPALATIGSVNFSYQPWGGRHLPGGSDLNPNQFQHDWRVKDPAVEQSDNWNFPTGELPNIGSLGRIHRGTAWQTIYMKSSDLLPRDWMKWSGDNVSFTNGNNVLFDAVFSQPTNDWHFASLWAQWLDTNDLATRLSINNPDPNAWTARLDGLTALTNSAPGELDSITISSNSPQAEIIAQAIQTARVTGAGRFREPGDLLAIPQLSFASPFINTNGWDNPFTVNSININDEALEKIPTQLLPLLRFDSFGKIIPANGQIQMSFNGYGGHAYAIEVSSNLTDWISISTNYPLDGNFGITNSTTATPQFYRSVLLQ